MTQERKARWTVRTGVLLSAALWMLIGVAAAIASPAVAPVNVDPPTITGTARVGEVLTARNGTWDNAPTSYRYRWLRCNRNGNSCVLLASDGETYRVGQADVGRTLRVRVTAVNADGATNARSEQTEVVGSNAAPLTNTARPTITGEARVGQELTASEGTWTGNPTSFSFQWQRCNIDAITCLDVTGATGRTYGVRHRRPRLPSACAGRGPQGRPFGHCDLNPDGGRRTDDSGHERAADASHPQGHVPGSEDLRALPGLRRPAPQSRDPGPRDAPWRSSGTQALCHSCRAASVRCVHAKLASGAALPRPGSVHDHAAGAGLLGQDESAGSAHVPPIARRSGWHRAAERCQPLPSLPSPPRRFSSRRAST